jgi:PAS domain S-box-containing protein
MVHVRQFTVLYVDDEELLLELGRRFLERNGEFRVDVVLSAQEALRLCFFDTYDAIISDYQMPGMDGIVLLKEIRKQGNDIPFILFTGKGREEVVIEAINNGAVFYVQKGGDPKSQFAELAHKIKQAVHKREVEKSLKDSKKQLSDVLNFLPDPTFAINNAGRVIAWNRAIEEMTGYSSSQRVGKGDYEYALPFYGHRRPILIDLIHESDERLSKYYTHISRSEDAISAEAEYVKIMGQRVFLYVKACPLYNSDGAITGAIESIRDITELKESAQKVEESRAKYKFLAEHSRDAIVIVAHDNTILYINATGVQLLEEDSIEAVLSQKNLMRYIHPDSADLFVYDSEQIKIGNEGYIAKYKLITAKEREIWVESQGLNIPYKDGRALFISLRDITQRKQIEEERERYISKMALHRRNFTRALLDALPIPVLWKDTQLRYLGCNEAYSRFFGVDKEYVTGKTAERDSGLIHVMPMRSGSMILNY